MEYCVSKNCVKRRFVIASEAKQSHNRTDFKEIATALRASQWRRRTFSEAFSAGVP